MNIQKINVCNYIPHQQPLKKFSVNNPITDNNVKHPAYPVSYANINFRGNSMSKLWDEYNWFIRHDRTPAIYSFLKIKETPEVMEKFLNTIFETPDRRNELFNSICANPRNANDILDTMKKILPSDSKNILPFFYDSPYNQAYNKFIENKVEHAHSLEELLKIRPDWRGEVLLNKFNVLKGNENLEIGNIPKELPPEHLRQIVDYLSNKMEYGMKTKKKIESLKLDNRTYEFAFFTEGKSDKNVFGIFTPEGKKYALKISNPERRSLDAPFALGTLAKIDSYLTYNRSRNSAPLCYYNHNKNFSIYKYIEHVPTTNSKDLNEISRNLPDFNALGLKYNDSVGEKNCFLMDAKLHLNMNDSEGFYNGVTNKEWISVDNDHVTYGNILQPSINKYHAGLPVGMQIFN